MSAFANCGRAVARVRGSYVLTGKKVIASPWIWDGQPKPATDLRALLRERSLFITPNARRDLNRALAAGP